jgi:hypothetical protein
MKSGQFILVPAKNVPEFLYSSVNSFVDGRDYTKRKSSSPYEVIPTLPSYFINTLFRPIRKSVIPVPVTENIRRGVICTRNWGAVAMHN